MADMRGAAQYAKKQQWAQNNRQKAEELLMDALVLQNELFDRGDLKPYLNMLAKMRHQNSRNLLLLNARMPNATCLTGFRVWQRRLPDPDAPVLRRSQKGKGIELLIPFTDLSKSSITWYAATHFDVSQVNVNYTPYKGPYKPENTKHISFLISAIHTVLEEHYQTMITPATDSEDLDILNSINAEGSTLPGLFLLRPDLSEEVKLRWLTVSLCRLFLQSASGGSGIYDNYMSLCAADCLFQIWSIPDLSQLVPHPALIMSVPNEERQDLLDLLQQCVHTLEAQISEPYSATASLDAEMEEELKL